MLAGRSLLNSVIIALAWPQAAPRPGFGRLLARNAAFTAVAAAVLSPWACISVAASGTSLSWFLLGELLPVIVLAIVLARRDRARLVALGIARPCVGRAAAGRAGR